MCSSASSSSLNDPGAPELPVAAPTRSDAIQQGDPALARSPTCLTGLSPLPPLPAQFWFARRGPPSLPPAGQSLNFRPAFDRKASASALEGGARLTWPGPTEAEAGSCLQVRVSPLAQTTSEDGNKRNKSPTVEFLFQFEGVHDEGNLGGNFKRT